ncbi:MAG: regulator of protease activity HflC (stomatin/prohibitin superfamily) [Myxococcota bacterium]|jgi:regulator of protease activity HflC (stomatin/prohibitin superfamily)
MMLTGFLLGAGAMFTLRYLILGFYTVGQNERAVVSTFGRAQRIEGTSTLTEPVGLPLNDEHRRRYDYPQLRLRQPGGPYFKWPWQKVRKVSMAIRTVNIAHDPETPTANYNGTMLDAVTKDQLRIRISGQMRFKVSEQSLYAYMFGVKTPIAHVMGYFISILRERIANFEAPNLPDPVVGEVVLEGVSINDLRKNLNDLNDQMHRECQSAPARYGIALDASLITGIDPPSEIDSALAAINTAHNEVSADVSAAKALADQKIEQSKRAVEIETMRAQAEVQPLLHLAAQMETLNAAGPEVVSAFVRNVKMDLYTKASDIILETDGGK